MNTAFSVALLISLFVSLLLVKRIWRTDDNIIVKMVLTLVALIPFVGPVFYGFYWGTSELEPQSSLLKDSGPRGEYTHAWISLRPLLKKIVKERRKKEENRGKKPKQPDS